MLESMMTRLALLLLLASPLQAGPIDWLKHQFRDHPVRTSIVIGGGAALIDYAGLRHCRRGNVERCSDAYGNPWPTFGIVTGWNTLVGPAVAESCWKDGHGKFCNVFAYIGSAYQTAHGIVQWRSYAPEKTDLRNVELITWRVKHE